MKATWNGAVLAESETTEVVDGFTYFPPDTVRMDHCRASDTTTN